MARWRVGPGTRERPEPSATYWPGTPAFPGGVWFAHRGSWRRIANRSRSAGSGVRGWLSGMALSSLK
jgi:hypothetical protein